MHAGDGSLSVNPPSTIASRYVQRMIQSRDADKQRESTLLRLREALCTIEHYANIERNSAEELLLQDMEERGNTRRPQRSGSASFNDSFASQAAKKKMKELAIEGGRLEHLVQHWDSVIRRCHDIKDALNEHGEDSSGYSDAFIQVAKGVIDEVRDAPWTAEPPREGPWSKLPSFFTDNLLNSARECTVSQKQRSPPFELTEVAEWSGVPAKISTVDMVTTQTGSSTPFSIDAPCPQLDAPPAVAPLPSKSSVRLDISCCCIDDGDSAVAQLYIGTERGLIFVLPTESLCPTTEDETSRFDHREVQRILVSILSRKARMDEEAAQLARRPSRVAAGAISPAIDAAPPSPTLSSFSVPASATSTIHPSAAADPHQQGVRKGGANGFLFQEGPVRMFPCHSYRINSLHIVSHQDHRGKLLISTSADKTIRWFNANTGAMVGLVGPERGMCDGAISYLAGVDAIVSGHFDGTLKVWDVASGSLVTTLAELPKNPIHSIHIAPHYANDYTPAPSSGTQATTEQSNPVVFVGLRSGHVYGIRIRTQCPPFAPSAYFSGSGPPNDEIVSAPFAVFSCFLPNEAPGSILPLPSGVVAAKGGHSKAVIRMASVATFLFTADTEGKIIKWDTQRQEKVLTMHGHIDDITAMCITSDGLLFSASKDGLWIIWDSNEGTLLRRVARQYHQISALVIGHCTSSSNSHSSTTPALSSRAPQVATAAVASAAAPPNPAAALKRKKSLKKAQHASSSSATELPFPPVPKQYRKGLSGSRECLVALPSVAECGDHSEKLSIITLSKDDTIVTWSLRRRDDDEKHADGGEDTVAQ